MFSPLPLTILGLGRFQSPRVREWLVLPIAGWGQEQLGGASHKPWHHCQGQALKNGTKEFSTVQQTAYLLPV